MSSQSSTNDLSALLAAHTLDSVLPLGSEHSDEWEADCDCDWTAATDGYRRAELAHIAHIAEVLTASGFGKLPDDNLLNRVEVIDGVGRALVKYVPAGGVKILRQDDGRTLKVLINNSREGQS